MIIRDLKLKDAKYMYEWMQDPEITKHFRTDFSNMNIDKINKFIINSNNDQINKHFAIVDENDEYLGTISLKDIDYQNKCGEYAICLRKKAMGKCIATKATLALFDFAFNKLDLHRVFLNVYSENVRANKFYLKVGFEYEGCTKDCLYINNQFKSLNWYAKIKD